MPILFEEHTGLSMYRKAALLLPLLLLPKPKLLVILNSRPTNGTNHTTPSSLQPALFFGSQNFLPDMLSSRSTAAMRTRYAFISSVNFIVFTFLDFLDFLFCFFYLFVDKFLEENPVPCYCYIKCEDEDEDELSETLCGRSNLFRKMVVAFGRRRSRNNGGLRPGSRRWSDCGCSECVSWQEKEEQKLHFVVKEAFQDKSKDSQRDSIENVIFIHGFLSSSLVWVETVFPNISENAGLNLLAADLLGFGKSPKPMDCLYRLKDHLDMIEKSLIQPFHLQSFHLVAHSMGCIIALALAAKYPKHIKSITLVGLPYLSSTGEKASLAAMNTMCEKKIWPPLAFSSAIMTWYEHLGRTICLIYCRNHASWEWLMKLFTRDIHFMLRDMTRHTHHSAWHTMHNVICGEAKFVDSYLETVKREGIAVKIIQGDKDQVTPLEYAIKLKEKLPHSELQIIPNADHQTVFLGREKAFTRELQQFWFSSIECKSASKVA